LVYDIYKTLKYSVWAEYLDAFAKLRKATVSFVMYVRPSVCPNKTTRLSMNGFT